MRSPSPRLHCSLLFHAAAIVVAGSASGFAQDASAKPGLTERIAALVARLNDDSPDQRERAMDALVALGRPAEPALTLAEKDRDPHVRRLAQVTLARLRTFHFAQDLAAFASDADGRAGRTMSGWPEFQQRYGADPIARGLFVEMIQAEPRLIREYLADRKTIGMKYAQRVADAMQLLQDPSETELNDSDSDPDPRRPALGKLLAWLWIGSDSRAAIPEELGESWISSDVYFLLYDSPSLRKALTDPRGALLRKLVVDWLRVRRTEQVEALSMAVDFEIPEFAREVARKSLQTRDAPSHEQGMAALAMMKYGQPEDGPLVLKLLRDGNEWMEVMVKKRIYIVEVRDTALATLLKWEGQDPTTWGMRRSKDQTFENVDMYYFAKHRERIAALDRWREGRK